MAPAGFALAGADNGILVVAFDIVLLAISLSVHEAAHAWAAYKLGDPTARDLGRMTLNPLVHIDLFMTIVLPVMCFLTGAPLFGGAKPVPVSMHRLRNPWVDMGVVAFAGPLSNAILACFFYALYHAAVKYGFYNGAAASEFLRGEQLLPTVLASAWAFNILLFVFNLIPIPPLDGSRILVNLLPESLRETYSRIGAFGLVAVFLLINYVPSFNHVVRSATISMYHVIEQFVTLGGRW